jgi:hypothetical protein
MTFRMVPGGCVCLELYSISNMRLFWTGSFHSVVKDLSFKQKRLLKRGAA